MQATLPDTEQLRLAALDRYRILDTPDEDAFDDITHIASHVCETPIAVVSLVAAGRQWFKSERGLGVRETRFESPHAVHAILQPDFVEVADLREDERFANDDLLRFEPNLRFFAGAVLETPDGVPIGTLCVMDHVKRELTESQRDVLRALARQVMAQLELRRALAAQQELNTALATTGEQLELAASAKDEILGLVSHELRNPLMAIAGLAQALRRQEALSREEQNEALDQLSTDAARLQRMIDNMLLLAKLDPAGEIQREPVLLQRLIPEAIRDARTRHTADQFAAELPQDLPAVLGDAGLLLQLLENLLTNASKYGTAGEPIEIKAHERIVDVELTVTNTGSVLSPETVARLFEPFFRTEEARSRAHGVGLGLAVCRRIAEAHGGSITADAGAAGGLEVCFRLPLA